MTPALRRLAREGYIASRSGSPESANPWRPETLGVDDWRFGWTIGNLPPVIRAAVAWVAL